MKNYKIIFTSISTKNSERIYNPLIEYILDIGEDDKSYKLTAGVNNIKDEDIYGKNFISLYGLITLAKDPLSLNYAISNGVDAYKEKINNVIKCNNLANKISFEIVEINNPNIVLIYGGARAMQNVKNAMNYIINNEEKYNAENPNNMINIKRNYPYNFNIYYLDDAIAGMIEKIGIPIHDNSMKCATDFALSFGKLLNKYYPNYLSNLILKCADRIQAGVLFVLMTGESHDFDIDKMCDNIPIHDIIYADDSSVRYLYDKINGLYNKYK